MSDTGTDTGNGTTTSNETGTGTDTTRSAQDAARIEQLEATIAQLAEQVEGLSEQVDNVTRELRKHHPADELPEEVALAISAAVAAYLGKRAKVKRVRVRRGAGWAAQARSDIHHSHAAFGSR